MKNELYVSKKTLGERYELKDTALNTRIKEMKALPMYGDFLILDNCLLRIDIRAFDHYMKNRYKIQHNLAFDPYKKGKANEIF